MEDGTTVEVTGADVYNLIFNSGQPEHSKWYYLKQTVRLYRLLERWYAERKHCYKEEGGNNRCRYTFWDKRQLVKKMSNSLYGVIQSVVGPLKNWTIITPGRAITSTWEQRPPCLPRV